MNGWESFLIAEVGASAALVGLIFVSVSINLKRILSISKLPNRALEALCILLTVLVVSSLLLVPNQSQTVMGIELLIAGITTWVATVALDINNWQDTKKKYRGRYTQLIIFNQVALLPYIIAGVVILFNGMSGLYWIVPGILFSFIKALMDAWVLLIEINR